MSNVGPFALAPYAGGLYLGWQETITGNPIVARYDHQGWIDTSFIGGAGAYLVTVRNFITFDDRLCLSYADDLYSYHTLDGWVLEATLPTGTYVHSIEAFGGWLWVINDAGNIYRWDGRAALVLDAAGYVATTEAHFTTFQGRLYLSVDGNVYIYEHLTGWRAYNNPALATNVIFDWAVFNHRLYCCNESGVYVTTGDVSWQNAYANASTTPRRLQVYDGYLYFITLAPGVGGTRVYRSADGLTWSDAYQLDTAGGAVAVRNTYGGRMMFCLKLTELDYEFVIWHQNALVLGGTPPHTGRAFTLRHTENNRHYVMMEVWEPQEEGDPLPSCDITPCTGPRIFCHVWIDPRWMSVRGDV